MRVLVDTNIILDQILRREPFFAAANKFLTMCATKEIDGYIAADYIVTRNPKDFVTSPIPCISTAELLAKIQ